MTTCPTAHNTVKGVLCKCNAQYRVAIKVLPYVTVKNSLSRENMCFRYEIGPQKKQKLWKQCLMRVTNKLEIVLQVLSIIILKTFCIKTTYLNTKNKLPRVNKRANFLALKSNTGIYIMEREKHRIPIHTQMPKAVNLWNLDYNANNYNTEQIFTKLAFTREGQHSFFVSWNQESFSGCCSFLVNQLLTFGFCIVGICILKDFFWSLCSRRYSSKSFLRSTIFSKVSAIIWQSFLC